MSASPDFRSGTFRRYRVVKLLGVDGRKFTCNIQYADSLFYSYNINADRDSINFYNVGDTLFIQYISQAPAKDNTNVYGNDQITVEVKLPVVEQLIVNNAEVNIQPAGTGQSANNMAVEIYGSGLVNLGPKPGENRDDTTETTPSFPINQLSVRSENAELSLGSGVSVQQLTLQTLGRSRVTIQDGAAIQQVQGNLSDSSQVNASWQYVRRLIPLTNP